MTIDRERLFELVIEHVSFVYEFEISELAKEQNWTKAQALEHVLVISAARVAQRRSGQS